jgi:hypothetical protein
MFSFVKSMQILTWPPDFGTTTISAHHSVGSSIREMTPNFSILGNSALTLSISGNGTLRGTDNANGFASGYNAIVYVQFVFPSP